MARRARKDNSVELILQLAGLVLLLCFVVPDVRRFIVSIGAVLIAVIVVILLLGIVGLVIYRLAFRPAKAGANLFVAPVLAGEPQVEFSKPNPTTTAQFVGRLRAVDWYQFEKIIAIADRKADFVVERRGGANPDGGIDIIITNTNGERTVEENFSDGRALSGACDNLSACADVIRRRKILAS